MKEETGFLKRYKQIYIYTLCLLSASFYLPLIFSNFLMGVLIVLWIIGFFYKDVNHTTFIKFIVLLISPFLLQFLSLIYSENLEYGFFVIEKKLSLLIFPIVFGTSNLLLKKDDFNTIINCFIYASILILLYLVIVATIKSIETGRFYTEFSIYKYKNWHFLYKEFASPINFHPTYLSLLLSTALALKIGHTDRIKGKEYVFIILLTLGLILLQSRIVIVANLILLSYLFITSNLSSLKKLSTIFTVVIFITFLVTFVPVIKERFDELHIDYDIHAEHHTKWNGLSVRLAEWSSALDLIHKSPVFGYGMGDVKKELLDQYLRNGFKYGYNHQYNAHNQYLNIILATGFVGLSVFIFSLLYPIFKLHVNKNIYINFIFLFGITFLAEVVLAINKGIVCFSFFQALIIFADLSIQRSFPERKLLH